MAALLFHCLTPCSVVCCHIVSWLHFWLVTCPWTSEVNGQPVLYSPCSMLL